MPKFDRRIQYTGLTTKANGIPPHIESPVKVRLPLPFPAQDHAWISTRALWDTGATHSAISTALAKKLLLPAVDRATIVGIHGPKEVDVYFVDILLMDRVQFLTWKVTAGEMLPSTPDVIIGMDVITRGDFSFCRDNAGGYVFSFIVPSLLEPRDFVADIGRFNFDAEWRSKNTTSRVEYQKKLRDRKKKR